MPLSNILVVVVDGLRASALGAYGNTTYPTPALDGFAADSLLLDACFAPAAELPEIYRALWESRHPARPFGGALGASSAERAPTLPRLLAECGYETTLVTDEPQLTTFAGATDFHECVQVPSNADASAPPNRASDIANTNLARIFAAATDVTERPSIEFAQSAGQAVKPPQLVWVHAQGMHGAWDAPLDLQRSLLDQEDSPPIEAASPRHLTIEPGGDPDIAFRFGIAYAAQAMVLDSCWQSLVELLVPASRSEPWLVMLLGARGYSLGEHQQIGGVDSRLPVEQLHVPWLIQFPDGRGRLARSGALVSHLDLLPTLLDWTGDSRPSSLRLDGSSVVPLAAATSPAWRDSLLSADELGAYSIRTASWCLRGSAPDDAVIRESEAASSNRDTPQAELFVRPDDRWEANDVAKLCSDVVEDLHRAAIKSLQRLSAGEPLALARQPQATEESRT
jgi:hypothetical protein